MAHMARMVAPNPLSGRSAPFANGNQRYMMAGTKRTGWSTAQCQTKR